jgi:hypothetical protein
MGGEMRALEVVGWPGGGRWLPCGEGELGAGDGGTTRPHELHVVHSAAPIPCGVWTESQLMVTTTG